MSDFNPLDRAKINTHRSSFDLSSKKLFTAKVGEILPCYWQIAIPGNKSRMPSSAWKKKIWAIVYVTRGSEPGSINLQQGIF